MYALKTLGLFQTSSVSQSSWGELIRERIGSGNDEAKLRKYLTEKNVADVESAIDAIKWLKLFDNAPLGKPS